MSQIWFMLTLLLDVHPLMVADLILLKEYRKDSFGKALFKSLFLITVYELIIFITYNKGLYPAGVMVALRVIAAMLCIPASMWVFDRSFLQCTYKCFICLAYTITILELSSIIISGFDTSALPPFMAITLCRIVLYLLGILPYNMFMKKLLVPSWAVNDRRVWALFTLSQFVVNMAMMVSLRTDYATKGIEVRELIQQLVLMLASTGVTAMMLPAFRMVNDVTVLREKEKRDEILLELSKQQYDRVLTNIEHMNQIRHDLRHHAGVLEQMLEGEQYDAAKEYLADYKQNFLGNSMLVFC